MFRKPAVTFKNSYTLNDKQPKVTRETGTVGASSFTQYFNKANEFSRNLKGRSVPVDGFTEGAMKYYNKGRGWERYIIVDPDGKIISFGAR